MARIADAEVVSGKRAALWSVKELMADNKSKAPKGASSVVFFLEIMTDRRGEHQNKQPTDGHEG